MRLAILICVVALGTAGLAACSRSAAPPPSASAPAPAAAPAPSAATSDEALDAQVRAELEKAAQQANSGAQPVPGGQSPNAMSDKDMAEARKAIEGMLENVRKELELKSAGLAQPQPNATPPAQPNAASPSPSQP